MSLLWRYRVTLVVSAVAAAVVGLFFGLTGPITFTSNGQLLLPATDPVGSQAGGSAGRADNSLVGIQVKTYADRELSDEVRRVLGGDAALLNSFSAKRQRDPIFYKLTADADRGPVARAAVQAGADAMIKKATELAKAQVDKLQGFVTESLGPLDEQSVVASTDVLNKQVGVDNLAGQVRALQAQIEAARAAAARAAVSGNGSASAGSAIASGTQAQLDTLNKQLVPAQAALEQAKSKAAVINAQRQGLQDQVQKATDVYLGSRVSSALAAPPTRPVSGRRLKLATMVGLEILVALTVAAVAISLGERRRLAGAMRSRLGRNGGGRQPQARGFAKPAPAPQMARSRR